MWLAGGHAAAAACASVQRVGTEATFASRPGAKVREESELNSASRPIAATAAERRVLARNRVGCPGRKGGSEGRRWAGCAVPVAADRTAVHRTVLPDQDVSTEWVV